MTDEQFSKMIKLLESIDWKLWEMYQAQIGKPTGNQPPTGLAGAPPVTPVTKASKSLYEQFVSNKK